MIKVRILRPNPSLAIPENWKSSRGDGVVVTRYDALSIIQSAHAKCPEVLKDIELEQVNVPKYNFEDLSGKRLLCVRTGGAGDVLMIAPSLMRLKQLYPTSHMAFATRADFVPLLKMMPCIDNAITLPIEAKEYDSYDYYMDFYDTIEYPTREARTVAGVDIFAKRLLVDPLPEGCRVVPLENTQHELKGMKKRLLKEGIKPSDNLVVYQFQSSNPNRGIPIKMSMDIVGNMAFMPNTHIVIVGRKGDCPLIWKDRETDKPMTTIHNWAGTTTMYELTALIELSTLCIAPDSAVIHLAGSFSKTCIGFFNVIPPELRVKDYVNHYPITTKYECSPCFCHGSHHCSKHAILIESKKNKAPEQLMAGAPCWQSIDINSTYGLIHRLLEQKGSSNAV